MREPWVLGRGECDDTATERVLLRAVLDWVACASPGHVARIEAFQRHASLPLLCEALVLLSNQRRYRFTLALVSRHIAVCIRVPTLLPGAEDAPAAEESSFHSRWPDNDPSPLVESDG